MTVPGVGFITALTFKAGVDDPSRFKQSRTVGATSDSLRGAPSPVRSISTAKSPEPVMPMCDAHCIPPPTPCSPDPVAGHHSKSGACISPRPVATDVPSSQWHENSPSSFIVCGSMTLSSDGVRRQSGHEITTRSTPKEASRRGRGLDETANVRCALKHAHKPGSPHCPTNACMRLA